MDASCRLILFLMLCSFNNLVFGQDYEDPEGLVPRFSRFRKNPRREKPDPVKDIDLTYPGCGFRSPKIQGTRAQISNTEGKGRGPFSHRAKRSTSDLFPMIVGGVVSKENSWPWMVEIYKEVRKRQVHCGASLISQKYVLTAAHCFDAETDPSKYSLVVGSHSIKMKDGTVYSVKQIIIHPGYKGFRKSPYHDIALIEVGRRVELSKNVYPVCLPSERLKDTIKTDNLNVTVTGWGRTSHEGRSSEKLQEVTIPIVSWKECNASYSWLSRTNWLPWGIAIHQICAGGQEERKDACIGDSGGPLVSKLKDNSYVQLGIVSFGYKCAEPGYPGVYTRVSEYTKWIYDNTDLGK